MPAVRECLLDIAGKLYPWNLNNTITQTRCAKITTPVYMSTWMWKMPQEFITRWRTCVQNPEPKNQPHRVWVNLPLVWENCLYSVNHVLNKRWLASSQAGNIGGTTIQEVEARQWEQEHSGKKEALSTVLSQSPKKQDVTCPTEKGIESCG